MKVIMDLRQLRFFTTLAETQNFRRAAARLNISQPPLTVAIRKLEEEIGTRLFERTNRGVLLTAAGHAALPLAREALALASRIQRAAHSGADGETGQIEVGFVGSAINELLPRIIPAFLRRYAGADLKLSEMTSADIYAAIGTRELDVGLIRLPVTPNPDIFVDVIEQDVLVAALPTGQLAPSPAPLHLSDLRNMPFIAHSRISVLHDISLLACFNAGFSPHIAQEAVQVQTILSLVQSGLGVALVPARSARFCPLGVQLRPLAKPVAIATGLVLHREARALAQNFAVIARTPSDSEILS